MKRSEYRPEWSEPHVLSFVINESGGGLVIHADLAGITMLIDELEIIREALLQNDSPHTHLWSDLAPNELTKTKLDDNSYEQSIVEAITIYGWNEEDAVRLGLKPAGT